MRNNEKSEFDRDFDLVLIEKDFVNGLTFSDIHFLLNKFGSKENVQLYPFELQATCQECVAMGFITPEAADTLDYDYNASGLSDYIDSILNDMQKESQNHVYSFQNLKIWLGRI